jgi:hypothetical protein
MAQETPAKQLYDLLISRDFDDLRAVSSQTDKTPVNAEGQPDVGLADLFSFDWHSESGKNYGTVLILLRSDGTVMLEFGNNLGKTIDSSDRQQWFDFMLEIKNFAVRNFMAFEAVNLGKIRHSLHGQRNLREGLLESWTGRRDVSWNADPGQTRLVIKHRRALGEGEARHHQIESLFVETADDQRFRLPFRNLTAGRAMLEHVRAGGRPWDVRGAHIAQMVSELAVLSRFRRANAGRLLEGDTATLVEQTNGYHTRLQRCLRGMTTATGYRDYFESWQPTEISEESVVIEGLKHLFVTQTIDQRIEDALPLLARIQQQEKIMKEADIFESWANRQVEGTWQLPDTPEKQTELIELLSQELSVGVDAVNATGQLQDILGDDELFDQLSALATTDPNADARQVVIDRLQELSDDPGVRRVLDQLQIDSTAEMNPPEAVNPADLEPDQTGVEEGATPTPGLQPDGKYYNKAGRLIGTWNGRTLAIDPGAKQYWIDEFGEEEAGDIAIKWQKQLEKVTAPSEDSVKYYANELEKSDLQANRPRQSRQQYYDLAVQMLSGQQGITEGADRELVRLRELLKR